MTYGNDVPTNREPGMTRTDMAAALKKLQQELKVHVLAQQKLEEQIREESRKSLESARKYQELVEETSDLIAHLDRRGHLTFINKAAQTLFGVEPDEYFGVSIFRFIHPDDRQRVKQWWSTSLADRASRTSIELRQVSTGTGTVFCLQWSASFHYDDGRMTGIGLIGRDVSAIRQAEQEKALLEAQLRRRHKMEAIGTLAGGIAHDFNNILAAILGYTDMAMEELPAWNPAKDQLKEVMKAGNRARDLVRQILAFSRREEQHREPVNLKAMIQEVVVFLRSTIPTTIEIFLDLDPQCGNILADQTQIHQVLMNICTNASQAMETESGTLSISLQEVPPGGDELDHTVRLPALPLVRVDISDTGPGIKEEHLDRIFDPYFTTKAFGKGSGMGLAVVHGIVKNHDGLIRVTGNSPRGTCFTLYFPRTEQKIECPALSDRRCDPGSERLLVVDDDPSIAKMLQTFLEKQGYATTTLCSSTKAFELFRAGPDSYDLIITDQTMPGMTGEDLAEKILKVRSDIPIVLCTGYNTMIDEMKAKDLGIKEFHMKPVALKDLAATVRRLLDEL